MAYRKLKDKHKKERSKGREGGEGRRIFRVSQTCQHFALALYCIIVSVPCLVCSLHVVLTMD